MSDDVGGVLPVIPETTLRITEVFHSLQGEARTSGLPTVFVRLTGCPLRCVYCDTAYAFSGGENRALIDIVEQVKGFNCSTVCVTGGEPLAQPNCIPLLKALVAQGLDVSLETSGAMDIEAVPVAVSRVMDLKTPDSQESHRNLWSNLAHLTVHDQIKFVVMSRADFDWAIEMIHEHNLLDRVGDVWISPSHHDVSPSALADWVLESGLPVRLQLQLHKILWNDEPGR